MVSAIIPAAGLGARFGEIKQFKLLNDRPLWAHSIAPFIKSKLINEIVLVVPRAYVNKIKSSKIFNVLSVDKNIKIVEGGSTRKDSVLNGVLETKKSNNIVCIHDAARPFLKESFINDTVSSCVDFDGAIVAIPSTDTIKIVNDGVVIKSLDREIVWRAQTPQTFRKDKLIKSFKVQSEIKITDESTMMELSGYSIKIIKGDPENIKITSRFDWELARTKVSDK
tara:strand:+ start:87 stop:758 length:672 start_codon:yes stop_codon:yes gene_type:complete